MNNNQKMDKSRMHCDDLISKIVNSVTEKNFRAAIPKSNIDLILMSKVKY